MYRANALPGRSRSFGDTLRHVLIEPMVEVEDRRRRREARWLAAISLADLAVFFVISLIWIFRIPGGVLLLSQMVAYAGLPIIYILARAGHPRPGVGLLLTMWPALIFVNIATGAVQGTIEFLAYLIPCMALGSIFLDAAGTALYGLGLGVAAVLLLPRWMPMDLYDTGQVMVFTGALATSVILLMMSWRFHNRMDHERRVQLKRALDETLEAWARSVETRDGIPAGHSRRVAELTVLLARACGLRDEGLRDAFRGALLHEVGMLGVPEAIVFKRGHRTEEEERLVQTHPKHAVELLGSAKFLENALAVPASHHERWDGSGYPGGLKGDAIPLAARIFAVAHAWDALLIEDAHSDALTRNRAIEQLRQGSGSQFDPEMVERFLKIVA